jgi:hypothetical protein
MINVKLQLVKQDDFVSSAKKFKSAAHCDASHGDMEGDGVIEFDQVFLLDDLFTMSAELHVRVFESSLIKDHLIGELLLPLRDDLDLASPAAYLCGKNNEEVGTFVLYGRQGSGPGEDQKVVGSIQLGLQLV